jgi:hypothetical protein
VPVRARGQQHYRAKGKLRTVDASLSIDQVWAAVQTIMAQEHQPAKGLTVTVCGGGNAAHIAAGMFSKNGADVNLFFSFDDEAKRFKAACDKAGGVTVTTKTTSYTGMPKVITASAEEAITGADLVLLIVPAFAHEPILKQIAPYLKENSFLGAIPGPGAFDLVAIHVLGDLLKEKVGAGRVCGTGRAAVVAVVTVASRADAEHYAVCGHLPALGLPL